MTERAAGSAGRVRELDGLRGLAVLLVILCHAPSFVGRADLRIGTPLSGSLYFLLYLFQPGWIGVDLFFVLSGYLITGILVDTASRPHYYRNFIARRILRILPLYYGFLLICLLPQLHISRPLIGWFFVFVGNIAMITNPWPQFIGPLWSLQVEEQFYLSFPWVVKKAGSQKLKSILQLAVVFAPAFRIVMRKLLPGNDAITYFLMPSRMDALAMGGLVAIAVRERSHLLRHWFIPRLTVICGVAFTIAMLLGLRQTIGYTLIDLTFTGVLILLITGRFQWLTAVCRNRALTALGTISYCLYLIHGPILAKVADLTPSLMRIHRGDVIIMLLGLAISVGVAALSWRYIETPILRLKSRLTPEMPRTTETDVAAEAQACS